MSKRRRRPPFIPMSAAVVAELRRSHPFGQYALYMPDQGEKTRHLRGYCETPCGNVGLLLVDPASWDAEVLCLGCWSGRLELINKLE